MYFVFGKGSKKKMTGLLPPLVEVNYRALSYGLMDFAVVQGGRTPAHQKALYAQGRKDLATVNGLRQLAGLVAITDLENAHKVTWTMDSNHLFQTDGYAHAYDVAPFIDGAIQWKNIEAFNFLATLHLRAANELDVPLVWGGHWPENKRDRPHFELKKGT